MNWKWDEVVPQFLDLIPKSLLWRQAISAYSGHYRPTEENLNAFLSYLEENGIKLDEIEVCDSFLLF